MQNEQIAGPGGDIRMALFTAALPGYTGTEKRRILSFEVSFFCYQRGFLGFTVYPQWTSEIKISPGEAAFL